jgi:hypothetical protein
MVKIMTGDLRIGLKESLVEEAIAKAYEIKPPEVQRANMLLGDIGETARLAASGRLNEARMRLFHPLGFMLASPVESTEEGLSYFGEAAVEDKYDGIRAQAHVSGGEVRIFSRTRDEITASFPELPPALAGLLQDAISMERLWLGTSSAAGKHPWWMNPPRKKGRPKRTILGGRGRSACCSSGSDGRRSATRCCARFRWRFSRSTLCMPMAR